MKWISCVLLVLVLVDEAYNQPNKNDMSCGVLDTLTRGQKIEWANRYAIWSSQQTGIETANDDLITIPIVFHVMTRDLVSLSTLENSIKELNDAFANEGNFNSPQGVETRFRFCLAQQSPDGGSTRGIIHVPSVYGNMDADLEHQKLVSFSKWNTNQYLNIWLVDNIAGEALAYYEGRNWWTRLGIGGYASGDGLVVTNYNADLLAHEIGHYFGLLHTWTGRDCSNDDCTLDGDMICDTPPDKSVTACGDNSCQTDTLSNYSNQTFFVDTLDMSSNFMDYSPCRLDFTNGQHDRMLFTLDQSYPDLNSNNSTDQVCESPCGQDAAVGFNIDQEYPLPNTDILFTAQTYGSIIYTKYRWYVTPYTEAWSGLPNSSSLLSESPHFTHSFPTIGVYSILLQAWDENDSTCFSSSSRNVKVTCGVDARYYPDKRIIASKQPHALFTDSVTFTNRSYNATAYEWKVVHHNFNSANLSLTPYQSNDTNLTYFFKEPGNYEISLTAINGDCIDKAEIFHLTVEDPTMDGQPLINQVTCLSVDSIQVDFSLINHGYDTINIGTPLAFYDHDPRLAASGNFLGKWSLNEIVYGLEETAFTTIISGDLTQIQALFLVFNDSGAVSIPLQFPPDDINKLSTQTIFPSSGYSELTYGNNVDGFIIEELGFNFNVDTVLCENERVYFNFAEMFDPSFCSDTLWWVSQNIGYLGSDNAMSYVVEEDDIIEVEYRASSGVSISGIINVQVPIVEVELADTVYRMAIGDEVLLNVYGDESYTYEWSPDQGLSDPTIQTPFAAPETNTKYTLKTTDSHGCNSFHVIQVWVETAAFVPNFFTPNGDGNNDDLLVYGLSEIREVVFNILNKEGVVVFYADKLSDLTTKGWDGTYRGRPLPTGVYFWEINGVYEDSRAVFLNHKSSGIIHLLR